MTIEAIRTEVQKHHEDAAAIRTRLLAVRKDYEAKIKEVDALLASLPSTKPVKAPATPAEAKPTQKGPSIGETLVGFVRGQPGATMAQIADAHPTMKRKSVENTVSRLTTAGTLRREGKGYAAA